MRLGRMIWIAADDCSIDSAPRAAALRAPAEPGLATAIVNASSIDEAITLRLRSA
jgi:hypothetical protein